MALENAKEIVETDNDRIVMVILLIFFPPLAVIMKCRSCNCWVVLCLVLYTFFILPAYVMGVWFCFVRGRKHENRYIYTQTSV
ncbi:unnamed protein product [Caenorhabditis angaria]|uniref:Uncharacterized protein n=1 Tax=Caenorhabditis angaria TaxID=860376 RepID=A0A9P1N9F7_9PELO|nr:unnamed protein product [Caenorhabditis angaria]